MDFQQWDGAKRRGKSVAGPDLWIDPIPLSDPRSRELPPVKNTHATASTQVRFSFPSHE